MKKILKDLIPAFVLTFSFCFMLFIYEPIVLYINNSNDFWFDLFTMIKCSLVAFIIIFFIIMFIYSIIYLLQNKLLKKKNIFNLFLIIGFVLFIVTYIQGNYLSGSLPTLDGREINWSDYTTQKIISLLLLISVIAITVILIKKYKYEKTINIYKNVCYAVILMLFVSLISLSISNQNIFFSKKYITTSTSKNINRYSSNSNLIVLLLDSIDSESMENIVKNNQDYLKLFEDFTYYPDTTSGYPFTDYNVPLLLSGKWYEEEMLFHDFYNKAMDESKMMKDLEDYNYNINIYNTDFRYNTEKARVISNLEFDSKVNTIKFIKQEIKYDLFKYLPFYLKQFSKIEEMDFSSTKKEINGEDIFSWKNIDFYNKYMNLKMEITNDKEFKYIHLEGAHAPYDMDENFNKKENATAEEKFKASLNIIKKYLDYLKSNNVYNNSAIIIMADHGYWYDDEDEDLLRRQNPILYIKGIDEHHERRISNEKVSFGDFQDIYKNLIDGAKTDTLFNNIDTNKPRRFLLYRTNGYDHLEEYYQYGHAKDLTTIKKTDKVYDLKK